MRPAYICLSVRSHVVRVRVGGDSLKVVTSCYTVTSPSNNSEPWDVASRTGSEVAGAIARRRTRRGRGPAAAAALGLPPAPVDHLEPSTASELELTVEHTEIASGLVVEPAHAPASKAVHKVVLLDAEPEVQQMPPHVDQAQPHRV